MKSIKQQRLEFLQDTVNYYSKDTSRRAVSKFGECRYYDKRTNNKCAIGRHINYSDYVNNNIEDLNVYDYKVYALLSESIRRLGKEFLAIVQSLHDTDSYWDLKGLTVTGKSYLNSIIRRYCK